MSFEERRPFFGTLSDCTPPLSPRHPRRRQIAHRRRRCQIAHRRRRPLPPSMPGYCRHQYCNPDTTAQIPDLVARSPSEPAPSLRAFPICVAMSPPACFGPCLPPSARLPITCVPSPQGCQVSSWASAFAESTFSLAATLGASSLGDLALTTRSHVRVSLLPRRSWTYHSLASRHSQSHVPAIHAR